MKQRVMLAMAIACRPRLLIADEPTTAQIMELLRSLKQEFGMAVLLITHDLGVVAHFAERVLVMYAGKIVEQGSVRDVFKRASHPYTQALLGALPDPLKPAERLEAIPGRVALALDVAGRLCVLCSLCARVRALRGATARAVRAFPRTSRRLLPARSRAGIQPSARALAP